MMRFSYYNSEFIVSGHSVGVSASVGAVIGFTVAGLLPLDSGDSYYVQEYSSPRFDGNNLPANRLFTYQMQVPVGVPFLLTQGLLAQAGARASMGSADFNVASEVYWNGVSEVTLDGTPVTDFSLTNDAGVDFGHSFAPVPEPSHYAALAGTGLLAFALARRIRQG